MDADDLNDAELAARLAQTAGRLLLQVRADPALTGRALGDAGDGQANRYLLDQLRALRPADGLLSEEERDDRARLGKRRVWIVDPLDGTREYSEGRDDWAVHVGLAIDGVASAGAVALPARDEVWRSDRTPGSARGQRRLRIAVSRTRPPALATALANVLEADLLPMGSAGAKAMAVLRGDADIYLHAGGQYEWDSCAPVAVAIAHGFHASRLDGSPFVYNAPDPYLPDLILCTASLADRAMEALSGPLADGAIR